jgi:esterase/lipase
MKRATKWFLGIFLALFITYFLGPRPPKPEFRTSDYNLPTSPVELEKQIAGSEMKVRGLKPDNQARIIWADSLKKEKTNLVFLYLHGFSASQAEGDPVHKDLAKKYNANLYLSRLEEHGIDRGDSNLINLTADNYEASAERALQVAEKLGNEVVVIGTSGGGALALFLASRHPEIKALILYSPCIRLYDGAAQILNKPWGLQIASKLTGGKVSRSKAESKEHQNYWTLNYRLEGLVALQNMVAYTMSPKTFSEVKCPVFLGYYYKDDHEHDKTVSITAMLKMFDQLGTAPELKEKVAFPEAGAHVIASYIRSKDWQSVEKETDKFLSDIVKL